MNVHITGGPHGRSTSVMIDGKPVKGVRSLTYTVSADRRARVDVELIPEAVELDVLAEWHPTYAQAENVVAAVWRARARGVMRAARRSLSAEQRARLDFDTALDALEEGLVREGLLDRDTDRAGL